jgi:CRISPR-associated protein Cas2
MKFEVDPVTGIKLRKYDKEAQVWMIVMFDLPVSSKRQRATASRFRKILLDFGLSMKQLSVYVKYEPDMHTYINTYKRIKAIIPPQGLVSILKVTEKQFGDMITYFNDKPVENEKSPELLTLFDNF